MQAKILRRRVFPSKPTLVQGILGYIARFNGEGRPLRQTKPVDAVLRSANSMTRH